MKILLANRLSKLAVVLFISFLLIPTCLQAKKIDYKLKHEFKGDFLFLVGNKDLSADVLRRNHGKIQFELDSQIRIRINKRMLFRLELELDEDNWEVEEFYLQNSFKKTNQMLKAGLQERFFVAKSFTEIFPLDVLIFKVVDPAVVWRYQKRVWEGTLSLHRGGRLEEGRATEDKTSEADQVLSDQFDVDDREDPDPGAGMKIKWNFSKWLQSKDTSSRWEGNLQIFYESRPRRPTSDPLLNRTRGLAPEFSQVNKAEDNQLVGGLIVWRWQSIRGRNIWIHVTDRGMQRMVQRHEGRYVWNDFSFLYSFSLLDIDVPHQPGNALTWDRRKHISGVHWEMDSEHHWIAEYAVNEEDTGKQMVVNDDILLRYQLNF